MGALQYTFENLHQKTSAALDNLFNAEAALGFSNDIIENNLLTVGINEVGAK